MATTGELYAKYTEIKTGKNPNEELAKYLNRLSPEARVFFLVNIIGWQDNGIYRNHRFATDGNDDLISRMLRE